MSAARAPVEPDPEAPVVIADALTALGYRLAGASVCSPRPDQVEAVLTQALARNRLVLITAELAAELPRGALAAARASSPSLVIIPDFRQTVALPDLGARVRAELEVG